MTRRITAVALKKEKDLTKEDWNFIMNMDYLEINEYHIARSKYHGLLAHYKKQEKE